MNGMVGNLRLTVRGLSSSRLYTIAVVLILALGIGANIAIFNIVDSILFDPLHVHQPERLVRIFFSNHTPPDTYQGISLPLFLQYQTELSSVVDTAAYSKRSELQLSGSHNEAEGVTATGVTNNFFQVAGSDLYKGRAFLNTGESEVVVLSYSFWRQHFAQDPAILNSSIKLNKEWFQVIGVASPDFIGVDSASPPDLWIPLQALKSLDEIYRSQLDLPENPFLAVVGRLKPNVPASAAETTLERAASVVGAGTTTMLNRGGKEHSWMQPIPFLRSAKEVAGKRWRVAGIALSVVVTLILLVACSNVGGLLLVRAARREKESAIRLALGASRLSVAKLRVMEGLVLSAFSCSLGVLFAYWFTDIVQKLKANQLDLPLRASITVLYSHSLVFAAIIGTLTTMAFSVAPAMGGTRQGLLEKLKGSNAVENNRRSHFSFGNGIVIFQIATILVLSTVTALFLNTIWNAAHVQTGIRAARILVADLNLAKQGYGKEQAELALERLSGSLEELPEVEDAALAAQMATGIEGPGQSTFMAYLPMVTPRYFHTLGLRLLAGREFNSSDRQGSAFVGIVNETFAKQMWGQKNPIGEHLNHVTARDVSIEVVGVVSDSRVLSALEAPEPTLYVPLAQLYGSFPWQPVTTIYAAAKSDPMAIRFSVDRLVAELIPDVLPSNVGRLDERLQKDLAEQRFLGTLLSWFSVLVIALGIAGIYGLIAYQIETRRKEIGIRVAVGAEISDITYFFIRKGIVLASIGIGLGLFAAFSLARLLRSMFFDISITDAHTYVIAIGLTYCVSLIASYLPTRRLGIVNPVTHLRMD